VKLKLSQLLTYL